MNSETRALRTSVLALLVVSTLRWASAQSSTPAPPGPPAPLAELIDSSKARQSEREERSRPLGEGEKVDPNRASEVELDRLPGIGASTAAEIVLDRERSGPFRGLQDLQRVKGIGPGTLRRIAPHVALSAAPGRRSPVSEGGGAASRAVDLNRADSASLVALPGIGPALASRILAEREKQPFRTVGELTRVRGVGAATVERLRPHIRVRR